MWRMAKHMLGYKSCVVAKRKLSDLDPRHYRKISSELSVGGNTQELDQKWKDFSRLAGSPA